MHAPREFPVMLKQIEVSGFLVFGRIFGFLTTFDAKLAYIGLYLAIIQFGQLGFADAPVVTTPGVNF